MVSYLEDREARGLNLASIERRLVLLAMIHGLLDIPSLTRAPLVHDALRGFRRRLEVTRRRAGPLRFGR